MTGEFGKGRAAAREVRKVVLYCVAQKISLYIIV
jgi:hypothetical protein